MGERLDEFMEALCTQQTYITLVFALAAALFAIQVPYLLVVDPGSALFVISTVNAVGFSVFAAGSGTVLWHCRRRE